MSRFFNKYILIIAGFYILWLGILPYFAGNIISIICENISYNTEYNVKIVKPNVKLSVLPVIRVKADLLEISDKNLNNVFRAKNPYIKIRLLPLLSGRLHINKLSSTDIILYTKLENNLTLDKDVMSKAANTKICCDSIKLDSFYAELRQKGIKNPAEYSGKNFCYKKNNRYVKFNLESEVKLNGKLSQANVKLFLPRNNDVQKSIIDITLSNLDISPLGEYLKYYLPQDIVKTKGIIDINADKSHLKMSLTDCSIIMKDNAKSIIFPNVLYVTSDYNLTRKSILIENTEILSKNIDVYIKGSIKDYLDRPLPDYNLSVQINKSKIEDFINLLPAFATEDIDVYKLKKYKFFGDIIGNLNIKGKNLEPSINGEIYINNGILTEPIKNTKGATVKLDFIGKYLNFDVFVPASPVEKVWVKGGVELYNVKYADMRVWSTKNVDLATAEAKVNPIHEILNFVIGPVPIMDIHGDGNIDIFIKGNRKNPHVWGYLNFNNVTTNFLDIPDVILKDASARLTFDDENAVFILNNGNVNGKKFDIKGTCNLAGKFDFDVLTKNQEIQYFYNAIQNSKLLIDVKKMLPKIDKLAGLINIKLKVYGNIIDVNKIKINENVFASGRIEFLDNIFGLDDIEITNTKGFATFDKTSAQVELNSKIGDSPLSAKVIVKDNFADLTANIPRLNLSTILKSNNKIKDEIGNIYLNINALYKGKIDKVEYDKVDFSAQILGSKPNNRIKVTGGEISLKKGKLTLKNINGSFKDSPSLFKININADNVTTKPLLNGSIKLSDFELGHINIFSQYLILPQNIQDYIKQVRFDKGKINLDATISNNNINASTDIGGIAFTYLPLDLPIQVINGSIYARKNYLGLNKINLMADGMPILIDGGIHDFLSNKNMNLYFNSKPKQDFIDKYINKNRIYPIKIKGDIVYNFKLNGTRDDYNINAVVDMAKDSSIYYLGAFVGDIENAIVLNLDMNVLRQNILKIREFSYDKNIDSQGRRRTRLNMLKAGGEIEVYPDDLAFRDLRIKTNNPTDARIFNIIFRKPNIKQGQFTSDLKFNGKLSNPKLNGTFHIFETNVSFLDIIMKNISFNFKDRVIELSSKGEVLGNDVKFKGVLKNKLVAPYYVENAEIYTKMLDLDHITNKLKASQVQEDYQTLEGFDLSSAVVKHVKMNADNIKLRNINAENFVANASLTEKGLINVNDFSFKAASGILKGNFSYSLKDNKTTLGIKADRINANDLTYALFDLKNQIYGDLTGEMKINCNGSNFDNCMKTLGGKASFSVANGRMPKLGSLEYLLRAGNLLKGGITGLSINSVIDIITPLKTGDFSEIYGAMHMNNGIAEDIEISTKGNNLSLFITGNYNFATAVADMEVLGLLSKKIATMFGPIGNVSINTLFNVIPGVDLEKDTVILEHINRIPGIELSSKAYRKFIAVIKGNINGEDYVKSFKWIN